MGEPVVTVERVRRVTPLTRTDVSNMFLTTCDLVCRTYPYINRAFFYDVGGQQDGRSHYEAIVNMLEQGLAKTLVHFYPLAGRLSHNEDGRLQIECNDEGVELLEASISPEFPFSDLLQDGFQYRPLFWKLAPKSDLLRCDYLHEPLLSIQVTRFFNGGLVIGVSMSHILADAQSFYDFMRCWAETCRNVSMSLPPTHIKTALSMKAMFFEDTQAYEAHKNAQPPLLEKQAQEEELRRPRLDLVQKVFSFSSEMLQQLKAKANAGRVLREGSCGGKTIPFTTFESFCAHWWQSIIRAKSLPPEQPVFLLIPVNCRQRFLNLPKSYFGNALDGAMVKLTAEELCEEDLCGVAGRIHDAIVATTEERFKEYIKKAEGGKSAIFHFDRTELFHIMDSPKFRVYDTDFGFGTPKAIRAEGLRYGCEVQIIAGRLGGGSFDFFCALDSQSMHRLEHDPSFISF
eukprot:c18058_g1_i2 orf=559-1932(-)